VSGTIENNAAPHASHNKRLVRAMVPPVTTSLYALVIAWSRNEEKAGRPQAHAPHYALTHDAPKLRVSRVSRRNGRRW
jgi:hypothetical protein